VLTERLIPQQRLISMFSALYREKIGARYMVIKGKDGKLLQNMRAYYSDADIELYMRAFFAIPDEFIQQSGYSFGTFYACLPKVIAWARQGQRPAAVSKANRGVAEWLARQRKDS
jgi:hypothetical protein